MAHDADYDAADVARPNPSTPQERLVSIMRQHIEVGEIGECCIEITGHEAAADAILSALDALPPQPTDEAVRGLVERLTSVRSMGARKGKLWNADGPEAAALIRSQSAEIARLQAPDTGGEVERLRAALKPFAAFAEFEAALKERWPSGPVHPDGDAALVWNGGFGLTGPRFTHGDIREALAALEASQ